MSDLKRQAIEGASFIIKHEEALRRAGSDPAQDPVLAMLTEELQEVQEQVKQLWAVMKEQQGAGARMPQDERARVGSAPQGNAGRREALADEEDNSDADDRREDDD